MAPDLICMVCGASGSKFYYGAISCIPCKSFFIRCCRLSRPYSCLWDGNCSITSSRASQGLCKACRYQKCLTVGMRMKPVSTFLKKDATPKQYAVALIKRHVQPAISLGYKYASTATDNMSAVKCAQFYANLNKLIVVRGALTSEISEFSLNVSLGQAVVDTNCCYSKTAVLDLSREERRPLLIAHNFVRTIADYLDFSTSIPEFIFLSNMDKLILLQNNYYMVLALRAIDEVLSDAKPNELQVELMKDIMELSKSQAYSLQLVVAFIAQHVEPTYKETNISKEEVILLQLITCFSQCEECSEQGKETIRNARNKYINLLMEYQNQCLPQLTKEERMKRMCTLMHFLKVLREFNIPLSHSFNSQIANNEHSLLGRLTYDLCMRVFKHS